MASKRRNMFCENKKQETTEIDTCNLQPFCDCTADPPRLIEETLAPCLACGVTPVLSWTETGQEVSPMDGLFHHDPVIDPEKVALDVPNAVITNGFNVVTRAAPIIGNVIQNSAERFARLVESLKPILGSSLGIGVVIKRETNPDSLDDNISNAEERSSRLRKRMYTPQFERQKGLRN
ncbi:hypothetical protein AAG570_003151 [Ranatra chinensis]|uniref:Uncharacterized protein n=1 Tax=Ranatra chinensis TaxID=642074 RepID=A0ABD0Y5Y0_9HEMI